MGTLAKPGKCPHLFEPRGRWTVDCFVGVENVKKRIRCILMRHGQALSSDAKGDFYRPLSPVGKQQVRATARSLAAQDWLPSHGFCSEATRTMETVEGVCDEWSHPFHWESSASLYLADVRHILPFFDVLDGVGAEPAIFIGHNPGWSSAIRIFTGENISLDVAEAALLSVEAESWSEASHLLGVWHFHGVVSDGL